jgi:hypothetical protein
MFPETQEPPLEDDAYSIAMIAAFRLIMGKIASWQSPAKFIGGAAGESFSGFVQIAEKMFAGTAEENTKRVLDVLRAFPTSPQLFGNNDFTFKTLGFMTPFLTRFLIGDCTTESYEAEDGTRGSKVVIERCRYLQEAKCKGLCVGICKKPTEAFFNDDLKIPMTLEPNFTDCSCALVWGKAPVEKTIFEEDLTCFDVCGLSKSAGTSCCPLVQKTYAD